MVILSYSKAVATEVVVLRCDVAAAVVDSGVVGVVVVLESSDFALQSFR